MFHVWDFPTSSSLQHPYCVGAQTLFAHPVHQTSVDVMSCSLIGLYQCASGAAVYLGKSCLKICVGFWWQNQKTLSSTKAIAFEMVINHLHLQSSQHISQSVVYMEFLHLSGSVT